MIHETKDEAFWPKYWDLPSEVRDTADRKYQLLKQHPDLPSLEFEKRCETPAGQLWKVNAGSGYRALAIRVRPDVYRWFWIGPHDEYERHLDRLC